MLDCREAGVNIRRSSLGCVDALALVRFGVLINARQIFERRKADAMIASTCSTVLTF
jgi:hypothetical protein